MGTNDDVFSEEWANEAQAAMKRLMAEHSLSYGKLAELTEIPKSTLSGIGSGEDRMTIRVLVALARAFNKTTDELLGLGAGVANAPRRKPTALGGVVDLRGVRGRFHVPIGTDHPELDLREGDLLEMDTQAELELGKIVAVSEGEVSRLYVVRSLDPQILAREDGPAVVFSPQYHKLEAVAVGLYRRL